MTVKHGAFLFGQAAIAPGEIRTIDLPLSLLSNHTPMTLPVRVVHGKRPGPVVFLSAAIHGDEILGVEIIRRVLKSKGLEKLRGTVLAVPIVNSYGFLAHSRYLPDRRDLNRFFPGSEKGSLTARLADLFLSEIVKRCEFGIDLHTAAVHRTNYPQLRYDAKASPRLRELADAFGAPVVMQAPLRAGSLREAAKENGVEILLYEAGEALRFDEFAIRVGVRGVLSVFQALGMVPARTVSKPARPPVLSRSSYWLRAPQGGIMRAHKNIGDLVHPGETIGYIGDPIGDFESEIRSTDPGIIVGRTNLPVVNQGDALFHIARLKNLSEAESRVGSVSDEIESHPLFDEDEIL
ncbi:MAG: succinylglutamate desuccinylase/aspartoacylase family protein [Rhizobiales bacterium]|nr:succinylglutamate desuccinylase/aspartoacylase family protein [Hyphomicrobiales bacterium]